MKITSTLFDIIYSELQRNSLVKYFSDYTLNQVDFMFNEENDIFIKILEYNENTYQLMSKYFFRNFTFLGDMEKDFEKIFLNKFIYKSLNTQTWELSRSRLYGYVYSNKDVINLILNNENLINEKSDYIQTGSNNSTNRSNNLNTSLPQTETNLNLDIDTLDYSDDMSINKSKNDSTFSNSSISKKLNIDNISKIYDMSNKFWNDIDKLIFSQIL